MVQTTETATPYTEQDFIRGVPETLLTATADPAIFTTWQHGDETLGPRTAFRIYSQYPELARHVDYMCAEPMAAGMEPSVRYIQGPMEGYAKDGTDTNRSYRRGIIPASYQEHRAALVHAQIENGTQNGRPYRYILDEHTSRSSVGRCMLVSEEFENSEPIREIIAASPIERIIVLPTEIARDGLIGHYDNSVSVEYERPLAEAQGVEDMLVTIRGLVSGVPLVQKQRREFYYVRGGIPKGNEPPRDAANFVWYEDGQGDGYYPVLYGENTYRTDPSKSYVGFAAARREIVVL